MGTPEGLRSEVARAAAQAAARAGDPAREPQIGYCLAVLTTKRSFRLDPQAGIAEQLSAHADVIAAHLAEWAATYDAIQAEFDRFELTTIRRFIPRPAREDDVIDSVALRLSEVIAGGVRTTEMALELAYEDPPPGSAYVFQSPLRAWIRRSTPEPYRPTPPEPDPEPGGLEDHVEHERALADDQLRELVERVAQHLSTRELLARLIERADRFEVELAGMRPASRSHGVLLDRLRAEIAATAGRLVREQRALRDMLAYIVLAMGRAVTVQAVAIASLRTESIDPEAIAVMAALMRALLTDRTQPTPSLIQRTRHGTARGVARQRVRQLERLATAAGERAELLAGVSALLDALPPVIADDLAAIAAALEPPSERLIVKSNRDHARRELCRVDPWFARVFNRYTGRSHDR